MIMTLWFPSTCAWSPFLIVCGCLLPFTLHLNMLFLLVLLVCFHTPIPLPWFFGPFPPHVTHTFSSTHTPPGGHFYPALPHCRACMGLDVPGLFWRHCGMPVTSSALHMVNTWETHTHLPRPHTPFYTPHTHTPPHVFVFTSWVDATPFILAWLLPPTPTPPPPPPSTTLVLCWDDWTFAPHSPHGFAHVASSPDRPFIRLADTPTPVATLPQMTRPDAGCADSCMYRACCVPL